MSDAGLNRAGGRSPPCLLTSQIARPDGLGEAFRRRGAERRDSKGNKKRHGLVETITLAASARRGGAAGTRGRNSAPGSDVVAERTKLLGIGSRRMGPGGNDAPARRVVRSRPRRHWFPVVTGARANESKYEIVDSRPWLNDMRSTTSHVDEPRSSHSVFENRIASLKEEDCGAQAVETQSIL